MQNTRRLRRQHVHGQFPAISECQDSNRIYGWTLSPFLSTLCLASATPSGLGSNCLNPSHSEKSALICLRVGTTLFWLRDPAMFAGKSTFQPVHARHYHCIAAVLGHLAFGRPVDLWHLTDYYLQSCTLLQLSFIISGPMCLSKPVPSGSGYDSLNACHSHMFVFFYLPVRRPSDFLLNLNM